MSDTQLEERTEMKTCSKCGEMKAVGEFYCDKRVEDGRIAQCKECQKENCKKYREANKEKASEYGKKWRKANSEKVRNRNREQYKKDPEKSRKHARDYYAMNREKANAAGRRRREKMGRFAVALGDSRCQAKKGNYQPCIATVEELEVAFTGKCTICSVPELEMNRRLCIDHDHLTGDFRGWLCGNCNKGLGFFKDNEEVLIEALHYLMQQQKQK